MTPPAAAPSPTHHVRTVAIAATAVVALVVGLALSLPPLISLASKAGPSGTSTATSSVRANGPVATAPQTSAAAATSDLPNSMTFFELPQLSASRTFLTPSDRLLLHAAFQPGSGLLALPTAEGSVTLLNPQTGQIQRTVSTGADNVYALAFDSAGKKLAVSGVGATVTELSSGSHKPLGEKGAFLTMSPDGRSLVLGLGSPAKPSGVITFWDATTAAQRGQLDLGSELLDLTVSPDGRTVYALTRNTLEILPMNGTDWKDPGSARRSIPLSSDLRRPQGSVAVSPDGKTLATSSEDENVMVQFRDATTGTGTGALRAREAYVSHLAYSPDGKTLYSDGSAPVLWNLATGKPTHKLVAPDGPDGFRFNPDFVLFAADSKTLLGLQHLSIVNSTPGTATKYLSKANIAIWKLA